MQFKDKKVLVAGLGLNGGEVGTVKWLAKKGAIVTVTDLKTKEELKVPLKELKKFKIRYVLGRHELKDFLEAEMIIKNPGVPDSITGIIEAKKRGIPVKLRDNLFMETNPLPVIGITGTKGKTTTTLLLAKILKAGGFKVWLVGNLRGVNSLQVLDKILASKRVKKEIVVAEFSSWQLSGFGEEKISPRYALITNIYPDHLNRYSSMEAYIEDKKNIYKWQRRDGILFLNKEQKDIFSREARGEVKWFSCEDLSPDIKQHVKLLGEHNVSNVAAAISVARHFNIKDDVIIKTLKKFSGIEHRLEVARMLDGVTYINDTASTLPTATVAALQTLKDKNIILISGGNSKNLETEEMVEMIKTSCKAVVFLKGNATSQLQKELSDKGYGPFSDFKQAILTARKLSKRGDYILLSPGFTSFGMFQNEFDRGDQFKKIVKHL